MAYAAPAHDSVTPLSADGQDLKVKRAEEEAEILTTFRRRFNLSKEHTREWRDEAKSLYDMRAGHQWDAEDAARLREELRPIVTFNVADKYIDAINGLQINNRQEIRYFPREVGDAKVNELLTGSVKYCRDETDAADEETDAFVDLALVGMGWLEGFWDEEDYPEGIARKDRRDPLEMYWDVYARKRNLSDAKWVCRIRTMDADEFAEKFPDAELTAEVDSDLRAVVTEFDSDDTGITLIEEPQDYENDTMGMPRSRARVAVADYQYWEHEFLYHVRVPGGEKRDLTKAQCAKLKAELREQRIPFAETKERRKCYYRCFIAGNKILRRTKLAWQEGFTYFCITGKRDRNKNLWYGVGRALRDPQMWVNKFFSQILHVINSNAKGGLIVEEDVFTDPRKAESEWANPQSITTVKQGAVSEGKLMPKPPPQYPDGMDRLMTFALQMLPQVSGLNPELIGLADRDQPGVLEAQRKQAALAIIAWCFDAMRLHYRQAGRWYAAFVRDFMADGRLIRINGEKGAQYIPLIRDRMSFKYDVIVDESPTSVNMKERVWAVLQPLLPVLANFGAPPPKEVLDYMPFPTDLVEAWKKQLEPNPEVEAQKKLAMAKQAADVQKTQADAQLNRAKAAEIAQELAKPEAGPDPSIALQANVDAHMEQLKTQLKGMLEAAKDNRSGELQILLTQMNNQSKENIAALTAAMQMATHTTQSKGPEGQTQTEAEPIEPDPVLESLQIIAERLAALRGPRTPVYDDSGNLVRIE